MNKKAIAAVAMAAVVVLGGCGKKNDNTPQSMLEAGNFEAASEAYIQAIEKDGKNVDLYIGLADAYVGMGEYESAVDSLCEGYEATKKSKLTDKMIKITSELYNTASEKVDYQVVLYCCERTLECGEFAKIYELSAMSYLNMEQIDKAFEIVRTGTEKTSDKTIADAVASHLYTLGSKAFTADDKATAKKYFEYVLEIDPENNDAANMISAIGGNPQDSADNAGDDEPDENKDNAEKTGENTQKEPAESNGSAGNNNEPAAKPEPQIPAEPKEPVVSNPEPAGSYTVQIGAYGELANAEAKVAKANAAGLSASYYSSGGLYRVTIGTFATESEANAAVAQANAAGFDAIIL